MNRLTKWIKKMFKKENNQLYRGLLQMDGKIAWFAITEAEHAALTREPQPRAEDVAFAEGLLAILEFERNQALDRIAALERRDAMELASMMAGRL